jgi:hypothetical protein
VGRRRRAAQQHRVAGLQAERRRVDRDVRPRLVDDGDDTERDADLAHVEPVGEPVALDHLTHRIREGDDRAHTRGHRRDTARVEREAIHQRG